VAASAAQRAVWTAVPGATISEVTSMERLMSRALAPGRYRAVLAGLFARVVSRGKNQPPVAGG